MVGEEALDAVLALVRTRVDGWSELPLHIAALPGGMTNHNYRIDADDGSYVLRLGGNNTLLLGIDRAVEHAASLQAARLGIGPEVRTFLLPEGYLMTRFIAGTPIPDGEIRAHATLARIATTLRRIHDGPEIPGNFSPFRVVERYAVTARDRGVAIPLSVERFLIQARQLEAVLRPDLSWPCHNDLLNANFLEEDGQLRILDWEYAGMGDRFFDLGNFSANHDFEDEDDRALLAAYFGAVTPTRFARLRVMRVMSDLREAMWGLVQQGISTLDFDFVKYTSQHIIRLEEHFHDPRFPLWLREAADDV